MIYNLFGIRIFGFEFANRNHRAKYKKCWERFESLYKTLCSFYFGIRE